MRTAYTIIKGQPYDVSGATVTHGRHGDELTTYYAADGSRDYGDIIARDHLTEVEAAVRRVIAGGRPETLTLGQPAPVRVHADAYDALRARMDEWERTDV